MNLPRPIPKSRIICVTLFVPALAGCSASHSDDPAALASFAAKYCDLALFCCDQAGVSAYRQSCLGDWSYYDSSHFDAASGDACLAALKQAQTHDDFCKNDLSLPACAHLFHHGSAQNGEPCTTDLDCADVQASCLSTDVHHANAPTACMKVAIGKAGDGPCVVTFDGAPTTSYDSPDPFVSTGYSCANSDGLYCAELKQPNDHRCTAFLKEGDDCSGTKAPLCAPDLLCRSGRCSPRLGVGKACTVHRCPTCPPTTPAIEGDCADGLYCPPTTSLCEALPRGGEPCPNGYCARSFACQAGSCVAALDAGASCGTDPSCVGPKGASTKCDLCLSGRCLDGKCAISVESNALSSCKAWH